MADGRMKGRVRGLLSGQPGDAANSVHTVAPGPPVLPAWLPDQQDPDAQQRALKVLELAQRTADDHIAAALTQADTIREDARATADEIVRTAQEESEGVRAEVAATLAEAKTAAVQILKEAQAKVDEAHREAQQNLAEARQMATETINHAQAAAAQLDREAQHRYDDALGRLSDERSSLQQQIGALRRFERDYRARLRVYMHNQLRVLDVGDPDLPPSLPAPETGDGGAPHAADSAT